MTTTIVIEHDSGCSIAWDSQATAGSHSFGLENSKVFANGEVVFAVSGDAKLINDLHYATLPDLGDDDWDADRWVTLELIPAVRDAAEDADLEGRIVAVVRGRAYEICPGYGWARRTDRIYVNGSGGPYALGALSAGATAREAIEIASQHDAHTGGQIHIKQATEIVEEARR